MRARGGGAVKDHLPSTKTTTARAPSPPSTSILYPSRVVCASYALGPKYRFFQVNRTLSWGGWPDMWKVTEPSIPLATPVDLQRHSTLSPGLIISGTMDPGPSSSHFPCESCVQSSSSSSWSGLWLTTTIVTPREARFRMGTSKNHKISEATQKRLVRFESSSSLPGSILAMSSVRRSSVVAGAVLVAV
jgi:hypothetical protein